MSQSNPGAQVRAPLTFIVPQDTKPCFHSSALTGGLPKVFFETEERVVTISLADRTDIPVAIRAFLGKGR